MPEEDLPEMPFLRNVGLIMTYKCQVTCPHCILEAGPHRTEELTLQDAFNWIKQIADYRNGYIKVLSLTGGEPFYNLYTLEKVATFGESCGLIVSAVTNAYWAKTPEKAVRVLRKLSAIRMLAISTDVHHQESIPLENVKNAVFAAEECGIPYHIAVCTENEDDEEYMEMMERLKEIVDDDLIKTAITFPAGRALKEIDALKYQTTTEPPISACSAGSSPIIFPDGRVIACIGPVIDLKSDHPLILGNLRNNSLEEILDKAELNSILHAIRIWGPKKLISLIQENGLQEHLPERYIRNSVCNACYSLMSNDVIVRFLKELSRDFEFRRKIGYARVYYLNETRMVELLEIQNSQNF
jgi:MoaA/NifB/PqqE/SkfB family radical SAM enzyme